MDLTIIKEIQAAELAFLQDKWDSLLVESWVDSPNRKIGTKIYLFRERFAVSPQRFNELKRIPLQERNYGETVSRFIAAHLPRISNYLLDHPAVMTSSEAREEAIRRISQSGIVTLFNQVDCAKRIRQKSELKKDERRYSASKTDRYIHADNYEKVKRSGQWRVCK